MSELLASYWRMPVVTRRTTRTAYLDLFDNGISTNVVLFVDRFKLQLPKWVLRDFLSLGTIIYPDAPINRRENPERVEIKDVMTERLTAAGFRYAPGHAHTYLPDARTDPDAALEAMTTPGAGDGVKEITELGYADTVRRELQEKSLTHSDVVKKIMISFFEIRPDYQTNNDAVAACRDAYGWNWFEFQAAWSLYHQKGNKWVAHNDPTRVQVEADDDG